MLLWLWWPYWHLRPNHTVNIYSSTGVADYWAPNKCMEPVVSHWVEKQKICLWAHQKVQRMKANTCLSFLWSAFGVNVMLFELCLKIHEHRIFVFRTWWIRIAWNYLIFFAISNLKLLPDLNKNEFKCCILICNGHNSLFLWNDKLCGQLTIGHLLSNCRESRQTTGHLTWSPKSSLSMLICMGIRGTYNANMVPNLVYVPIRFGWDSFIIKEFIGKNITCGWLLGQPL